VLTNLKNEKSADKKKRKAPRKGEDWVTGGVNLKSDQWALEIQGGVKKKNIKKRRMAT